MRIIFTAAILTGLAVATGHCAGRIQNHLQNKAVGLPDELPKMPAAVLAAKQKVVDDFEHNDQFRADIPDDPSAPLWPVDPERRQAAEMSEIWGTVRQCAHGAAWIIPVIGVVLLARKLRAKMWPPAKAAIQEFGSDASPGPLDESGGIEGEEAAAQLADLKAYLSASMKHEALAEESEDRPALLELLAAFKGKKARG